MRGHCPCDATGRSSHAIANAFGHCKSGGRDHPYDPADLMRCINYCDEHGVSVEALTERMSKVSPQWAGLVADWPALVALFAEEKAEGTGLAPRTPYDRMKRLLGDRV